MSIFQPSVLKSHIALLDHKAVDKAYKIFANYFLDPKIQENIKVAKEEQYQATFLSELFVKVFGYTLFPDKNYNLVTEQKNEGNSRKADGAILKGEEITAVIELKGTKTKDLESIRKQAFDYKNFNTGCSYVITSNFEKLRFYIDDASTHEEFDLFSLSRKQFELLYLCLNEEHLLLHTAKTIKEESLVEEEKITKSFYKDYSLFKRELWKDLASNNVKSLKALAARHASIEREIETDGIPAQENDLSALEKNVKRTLFKKSQKLIDRFLFIFFAEDRGLLKPNYTLQSIKEWETVSKLGVAETLYDRFKLHFNYLDQGRKSSDGVSEIFAYNGGLFKPDTILDNIVISDELLLKHTKKIAAYDFESQVDVNILGHIFENSLNEIESVNAEIDGANFDKQTSKRKKDGVFYTPKYITKYIVDNTVGKLCEEKKTELGFAESEYYRGRKNRNQSTLENLVKILDEYREWLLQLTICDPACGSGAFLNQALDFLITEHNYIDELKAKLLGTSMILSDIENTILENNIYGVDLNEESVEIAKLSLWLRTAQPRRKLNDLSSNIKCGNSLIDVKAVAGDKAFKWETEFPQVFAKGGFDVVIGNPPYGAELSKSTEHLKRCYNTFSLSGESYILFIEKSLNIIKFMGRLGFIIPDTYLNLSFSKKIRDHILRNSTVENIVMLPAQTFDTAVVDTTNLFLQKQIKSEAPYINDVRINLVDKRSKSIEFEENNKEFYVSTKTWVEEDSFLIYSNSEEIKLLRKIDLIDLSVNNIADMYSGIKAYEVGKGNPKQTKLTRETKPFTSETKIEDNWMPFYEGKHITSYQLVWNNDSFIKYGEWLAAPRNPDQFLNEKILIRKIIGSRLIATYVPETSYCNTLLFVLKLKEPQRIKYEELLGILNSRLIAWYFRHKFQISDDDTFPQIMIRDILKFPIILPIEKLNDLVICNLKYNKEFVRKHNMLSKYLKAKFQLQKLSKKLQNWHELDFGDFIKELNKAIKTENRKRKKEANVSSSAVENDSAVENNMQPVSTALDMTSRSARPDNENDYHEIPTLTKKDEFEWMELFEEKKKEVQELQSQINQTEREIDQMVYELYGLSDEEIKIVEGS